MAKPIEATPTITGEDAKRFLRHMLNAEKGKMTKQQEMAINRIAREIKNFAKTKIPRCAECLNNYEKIDAHSWKPVCKCYGRELILCVG